MKQLILLFVAIVAALIIPASYAEAAPCDQHTSGGEDWQNCQILFLLSSGSLLQDRVDALEADVDDLYAQQVDPHHVIDITSTKLEGYEKSVVKPHAGAENDIVLWTGRIWTEDLTFFHGFPITINDTVDPLYDVYLVNVRLVRLTDVGDPAALSMGPLDVGLLNGSGDRDFVLTATGSVFTGMENHSMDVAVIGDFVTTLATPANFQTQYIYTSSNFKNGGIAKDGLFQTISTDLVRSSSGQDPYTYPTLIAEP